MFSVREHREGVIFIIGSLCVCSIRHKCINETGQWVLQVSLPVAYKSKDSYMAILNSNAVGGHDLFAQNLNDRTISIQSLNGAKESDIHIITIGIF